MPTLTSSRRSRVMRVATVIGLTMALAIPAMAAADTGTGGISILPASSRGATITVAPTATLTAGVLVTLRVSVVCDPLVNEWDPSAPPSEAGFVEGGGGQVIQSAKKAIAAGSGELYGRTVVCDGRTVNAFDIPITSQTVPFRKGDAVAGASLGICDLNCSGFASAASGPTVIKLVATK